MIESPPSTSSSANNKVIDNNINNNNNEYNETQKQKHVNQNIENNNINESKNESKAESKVENKNIIKKGNNEILSYNGQTIITASSQGNLPVCVLLWGMASAKKINIMSNDIHGNNPMHYACLANNSEVMAFFHQQLRGMLTPEIRLVDSVNNAGETPLLRAMSTGQMTVIKVNYFILYYYSFSFF